MKQLKQLMARLIALALRLRIVRAFLRYTEHHGSALADSVTYRALFSVFAALLLGFSIAAMWLGGSADAMRALTDALDEVIPGLTDMVDPSTINAPTSFTIVGIASLVGLVGAAISAITSLRIAIRTLADQLNDDGFFLWVILRNLGVAIGFGGLLAVAAALSVVSSVAVEWFASALRLSGGDSHTFLTDLATRALSLLIVFAIDTVAIVLVFRLLSGVRPPTRALWTGAMLGGLGLVVLQELSGLFVRGATSNPLLASFAALIALLLWFNLSAQVILIACTYIVVATDEARDRVREKFGASTLAQLKRRRAEDRLHAAVQDLEAAREAERAELAEQTPGAQAGEQPRSRQGAP